MSEAFFKHCDECDFCSWVAGRFCAKAKALIDAAAQHAAERMAPIPYLVTRAKAKA